MKTFQPILFIVVSVLFLSSGSCAQDDTLTASQCNNPEQIVTRLNSFHIEYVMHEYELNIHTVKGYLYNNGAAKPYLDRYNLLRGMSYASFGLGIGGMIANSVMKKSFFSPLGLGGSILLVCGFPLYFKSNEKFRLSIYEYNRSLCKKRRP